MANNWRKTHPHQAPPVDGGVMSLYNQGTCKKYYWKCVHCGDWSVAEFKHIEWEKTVDIEDAAESAKFLCPHCGALSGPEHKEEMNQNGRWLSSGQKINSKDEITGEVIDSKIDSYWLNGAAAAFQPWSSLVREWLKANREYDRTGSETALQAVSNVDLGIPYLPKSRKQTRSASELKQRAEHEEYLDIGRLPEKAEILIAAVDVQVYGFVVQWYAFGPGMEWWLIDRAKLVLSKRANDEGNYQPMDPASYLEDWDELVYKVLNKEFMTFDGQKIVPMLTVCDSGGASGTTTKAYDFYRKLARFTDRQGNSKNYQPKFRLVKGAAIRGFDPKQPICKETWPNSVDRKDRKSGSRGDIPVLQINNNILKDSIVADLKVDTGPGAGHIMPWLDDEVFDEFVSEVRLEKGWERIENNRKNEAWILTSYAKAAIYHLGVEIWGEQWEKMPTFYRSVKKIKKRSSTSRR